VTSLLDSVAVAVGRDRGENQKTSSHNHASKHDKDEKEATDSSGPDSNTENSSNTTSNSNGDMSSEPSREGEAAPSGSGATTGETVTKSPSSGGISAGAAVGIAVGGIVAAAGAFLAGRRTRTTASPDVPVTVHKPNSASTVNVQSATDLDVPSISNDATDSPSKRDDV
jgi:hypothetical protein